MNLKKIICLTIAAGVSSHALALEIYHGRITSEKSWSTDGKKVTIVKQKASRMMAQEDKSQFQYVQAAIDHAAGNAGQPITLENSNEVYVENTTPTNKTYRYMNSVCATISDDKKTLHCVYVSKDLELDGGGYFREDSTPQLTLTFDNAGTYQSYAETNLFGDGSNNGNSTSVASSDISVS